QAKPLWRRFIEAELRFEFLDKFRVEPLRATIFRRDGIDLRSALRETAIAKISAGRAGNTRRSPSVGAGELGNHLLNGSARSKLHHNECHQHDAEHGRQNEQQAANDIGGHASLSISLPGRRGSRCAPLILFVPVLQPCRDRTTRSLEYLGNSVVWRQGG